MSTLLTCPGVDARYRTLRLLSRGEATERRLAVHAGTGRTVVVTLADRRGLSAEARERFDSASAQWRELRVLGLAELLDGGCEDDIAYVVSEYAVGMSLRSRLRSGGLDVTSTLEVLAGVLSVLAGIHRQGLVHCDLRPSTVVLRQPSPVAGITVVGPGSAWSAVNTWVPGDKSSMVADYLAPEQAGLLDRAVDSRADLYAAGVLAFECLAGRPPFAGAAEGRALGRPLSRALPSLRELGVRVPQALEEVLRRLTHKDPEDRYGSAQAVLADVLAVATAIADGQAEPDVVVGTHDRRRTLTEPPLTGRAAELTVLNRRLEDAREGVGRLIVVEAESGGGKSRLLDEFCQRAAAGGAWVLRGHGVPRGAQLPLQVLEGVAAGVVAEHGRDATLGPRVRAAIGPAAAATLGDVLPVLRTVLGTTAIDPVGSEVNARARAVGALVGLVQALGTPDRPAVIALDDCHWADEITVQALAGWAGGLDGARSTAHVLVVVAIRPEDGATAREALHGTGAEPLVLGPLSPDQIAQVVESMAGSVPQAAIDVVEELSRGNPFMASAVLRGLVEAGALTSARSGWQLRSVPGGWQASREAAVILGRRLDLMSDHTRTLLSAGAVLGREFDLLQAAALAGQAVELAGRAVVQALDRHLVWEVDEGRYAFVHDRLREGLLTELDPPSRAALHLGAAEDLQAHHPAATFGLAYHFDAAGVPGRALEFALESAESARSRHDLALAESLYRIAERGMIDAPDARQYTVAQALGQILMLRGRYDEAFERFERAQELARDDLDLARVQGQLGELLFRRDDLEGASRHIESGLRVLGERIPVTRPQVVFRLGQEVLRRTTRGISGQPREDPTRRERERLRAHLYTQLQYPRWFHGNRLETLWLMVRQVNVAERCPDSDELAHSYAVWGGALALMFPFLSPQGMAYIERSSAIYAGHGDLRGIGHAASMRTCVLLAAGRYREGVDAATEAAELLRQYGDPWELGWAVRNRAICLYRLGRLTEAVEDGRAVHRIGLEVGDANAEVTALEVLAKATGGQVPAIRTQSNSRRGADLEVTVAGLQATALRLRREHQLTGAVAALTEAAAAARRALPTNTYVAPVFAWLATVHREVAEEPFPVTTRAQRLRTARRSARLAVLVARFYPNDLPHALRELGLAHALSGSVRQARRRLNSSETTAIAREAWGDVAETRRQRGRLGLGPGPSTRAVPGGVQRSVADLPTLGLADRFEALLEAGATLASADSVDAVVDGVAQTALALLRAEYCLVVGLGLPVRPDQAPALFAAGIGHDVAGVLPQPVVLTEPFGLPDTVLPGGTRSALYAPVLARNEIVGYFLATHSQVGQLFGAEEERLAEFIARLAGAAYERQQLHRESRGQALTAQEAERARIARDLHDEIGQALTSVLLGVHLVEGAGSGAELTARASELRGVVVSALESVQRLAFELRPAVLSDLGLLDALRRLIDSTGTGGSALVELEILGLEAGTRFPEEVETTVYRIVQESLTNVARHAAAAHCSVVLGRSLDRLRVVIEDDGIGFDQSVPSHVGLGLRGMNERAGLVGGSLRLTTRPGTGTSVVLEVPLD